MQDTSSCTDKDKIILSVSSKNYSHFGILKIFIFLSFNLNLNMNILTQPDYLPSLDYFISLYLNIYTPWISAYLTSSYCTQQLQRIKNKKMQQIWFLRVNYICSTLINLPKQYYFWSKYNYTSIKGIYLGIKGRAADMRWVMLRSMQTGYYKKWTKNYSSVNFYSLYSIKFFLTKWGVVSFRIGFNFTPLDNFKSIILPPIKR